MFTQVMGTGNVKHLARGAAAGIKQTAAQRIWQVLGGHIPAVTPLQGSKRDPVALWSSTERGFGAWQCRMAAGQSPTVDLWEERTDVQDGGMD